MCGVAVEARPAIAGAGIVGFCEHQCQRGMVSEVLSYCDLSVCGE
jgi:hypothetical protein